MEFGNINVALKLKHKYKEILLKKRC